MAGTQTHKFHEVIIDLSSAALHNEDIFPADRLSDLDPSLAHGKLGKLGQSQLHVLAGVCGVLPAVLLGEFRDGRRSALSGVRKAETSRDERALRVSCGWPVGARLASKLRGEMEQTLQAHVDSRRRCEVDLLLPPKTTMLRTMTTLVGSLADYAR